LWGSRSGWKSGWSRGLKGRTQPENFLKGKTANVGPGKMNLTRIFKAIEKKTKNAVGHPATPKNTRKKDEKKRNKSDPLLKVKNQSWQNRHLLENDGVKSGKNGGGEVAVGLVGARCTPPVEVGCFVGSAGQ